MFFCILMASSYLSSEDVITREFYIYRKFLMNKVRELSSDKLYKYRGSQV